MDFERCDVLCRFFFDWREEIYKQFEGLFNSNKILTKHLTEKEIKQAKDEQEKYMRDGFGRWNWYGIIEKLALGDITKFKKVRKQRAIDCFEILSYWRERDLETNKNKE